MQRGLTGRFEHSTAGGQPCQAFVPAVLPPVPPLAIDPVLQEKLGHAHLALGRLDSIATLLPQPALFLYSYVRKEAVLSSQIEGTQSSLSDLLLYENQAAPGVPLDDVQEVSCYVQALEVGVARIRDGWPLSTRLLLELHAILLASGRGAGKGAGEFRRTQVWIGGRNPVEAAFVPPPPQRVPEAWAALERFLNDQPERQPTLIKAALAHVQFETIHPFLDGNGRLGRLLIPLIFLAEGVLAEPLLYLSLYFKRHRQDYYAELQQVREQGDWERWLGFFADAVADTAQRAVATAQALNQQVAADRRRLQALGRIAGSALQVLDALAQRPVANINALQQLTGLTPATLGKVLTALESELDIVRELTGQKRNRVFAYRAYLATLTEKPNNQIVSVPLAQA